MNVAKLLNAQLKGIGDNGIFICFSITFWKIMIDYSTCLQVKAGMEGDNETVIGEMHADEWTHV